MIRSLSVFAALVGVVALCGCGSSSDSGSTGQGESNNSEASPSSSEFVEKADAICKRDKRQASLAMASHLRGHEDSGNRYIRVLAAIQAVYPPVIEKQIKELYALTPPKGEGWQVKAFAIALKEGIYSESRTSVHPQFSLAFKHSAELARTIGINACIYGHSGSG